MIYPNDCFRDSFWDIIVSLALLITIVIAPINIAFNFIDREHIEFQYINLSIDIIFAIDIVLNFFFAVETDHG